MNNLTKKPHLVYLTAIPILILMGVFSGDASFDINIKDTYLIVSYLYLTLGIAILFGIIGIGYWMVHKAERKLSKWLTWTHIILTLGGTLAIGILIQFNRTKSLGNDFNSNFTLAIYLILFLIVIGQLIFPINIIYGLAKGK
ncbi:hypothetical protein [Aegicerativicinus sediminis]|uniref:hypothetical protein n=1 Tax=Aegicerativicinus sediminis TaxID=2893202 RepID=UPI001E4CA812|nr:hypothetical protein [Aegicerativicinus sediminis]